MSERQENQSAPEIVTRLRIVAGMISMGERIAWGSDSSAMYEAADIIEKSVIVLEELAESAEYWSEYDVPIGIVEKIKTTIAKARCES